MQIDIRLMAIFFFDDDKNIFQTSNTSEAEVRTLFHTINRKRFTLNSRYGGSECSIKNNNIGSNAGRAIVSSAECAHIHIFRNG